MIILGVLVVLFVIAIVLYNGLVRIKNKCEEALSGIDVALSKRYNVLTNLQVTIKGAAAHEKEGLENITAYRAGLNVDDKTALANHYDAIQNKLLMVVESYPNLKVSENFLNLQNAIVDSEEHIQAARRFYNSNVSLYNQKVEIIPSSIIASMMNYKKFAYFVAEENEKDLVKVSL